MYIYTYIIAVKVPIEKCCHSSSASMGTGAPLIFVKSGSCLTRVLGNYAMISRVFLMEQRWYPKSLSWLLLVYNSIICIYIYIYYVYIYMIYVWYVIVMFAKLYIESILKNIGQLYRTYTNWIYKALNVRYLLHTIPPTNIHTENHRSLRLSFNLWQDLCWREGNTDNHGIWH